MLSGVGQGQLSAIGEAFDMFDKDGDGLITREEFKELLVNLGE